MVTTVTNNSPQAINTSLFSLQKEIDDLQGQINQTKTKDTATESELAKGLVPGGKAGQVYTSNGTGSPSWQDVKGEKGDQGPRGPQGIQGERGLQGIQGIQGEVGPVGPQGPKGDKGDKGDIPDVSDLATKASVEAIEELIPDTTTSENQLADKDFVNSSIATNTSYFVGTFDTLEELESQTATNNDYAFWKTTDSDGNVVYKRYKYNGSEWAFEYDLNNSSFTAEQWATINSGLTAESLESKQDTLESGVNIKTINGESVLGEGNIEIQGGGSLEVTDSTDELTDEYSFIETGTGTVTTGKRHLLSKLWTWITKKLSARTSRLWTGSGAETYTQMSLYTDENGFTFENPLTGNDPSYSDKPFKIHKRGGYPGTMQVGQIRVDGTSDKHNYNECLRLNRYSSNDWATIALGGASGTDYGTDDNTWCLGATPSNEPNNPNELVVNRNGSSGGYSASFYKDRNSFTGLKVSGVLRNTTYGMAHEVTASKTMFYDNAGRYIQIRLLDAWVNNMLSFKVRVSHYANGRMAEYLCYGYTYYTGQWYNCKAIEIGSTTSAPMRIWFGAGSDGVATVLLKWEDIGVDDYPQVDVYDVSSGYSVINYDPSNISVTVTQSINWARQDTTFLIPKVTDKLPIQYNLIDSVSDYYEFHYSESSDGTIVFSPNSSALNNKVNDFLTFIQNVPINDVKITFITSMITSSGTGQYFKFVNCPLKTKSGYRYISLNENVHLSLNPYSDAWLYIELFGRGSQFSGNDSRNNRILCASLFI